MCISHIPFFHLTNSMITEKPRPGTLYVTKGSVTWLEYNQTVTTRQIWPNVEHKPDQKLRTAELSSPGGEK